MILYGNDRDFKEMDFMTVNMKKRYPDNKESNTSCNFRSLYRGVFFFLSLSFSLIYLALFVNYVNCFYSASDNVVNFATNGKMSILFIGGLTVIFLLSAIKLVEYKGDFLFKYRWIIGISVALLAVAFRISGSSLGMWSIMLPENSGSPVWGIPRSLRSDEFSVGTLFQLSQSHNNYAPISEILRGDSTDVRMVYGAACWSVITLFRPTLWGYLLFGFELGLAYSWSIKLCLMVLVSFDCAFLLIKSKSLSLLFSCLLCFSPLIQWWGTGEVILYGQALVLLLNKALFAQIREIRLISIVAIAWLCGCYIVLMYPAWMVPFFFIFAAMGIFQVYDYYQKIISDEGHQMLLWSIVDTFVLILTLLISATLVLFAFSESSEAMASVVNTVYPGARFETGGSGLPELFSYALPLFYSFDAPVVLNKCEMATILCFFPLGTLASSLCLIKKRDGQQITLLALQVFFLIFAFIGFPPIISRLTLMYNVPTTRLLFPMGYLELLLFLISIKRIRELHAHSIGLDYLPIFLVFGIALSFAFQIISLLSGEFLVSRKLYIIMLVLLCVLSCILFGSYSFNRNDAGLVVLFAICFGVIPGFCINPIQVGAAPVVDTPLASLVDRFTDEEELSDKWIVDGSWTVANLCASYGAPVINSTNAYPDIKRWELIDPKHEDEYAYNRYAHIVANVFASSTSFTSPQPDLFSVDLTVDDLMTLGVRFVVSSRDLLQFSTDQMQIEIMGSANGFTLYKLDY